MVINTTRWSPDTCSCEVEYSWDTDQPESERQHNFARVVRACEAHKPVVPRNTNTERAKQVFETVLEENQRKNQTLGKAFEVRPELADVVLPDGKRLDDKSFAGSSKNPINKVQVARNLGVGLALKEGVNYTWRWIEDKAAPGKPRTLEIDFELPVSNALEDPAFLETAAKTRSPDAISTILEQKRHLDKGKARELQQVLNKEFVPEKGRGKVMVKGAA